MGRFHAAMVRRSTGECWSLQCVRKQREARYLCRHYFHAHRVADGARIPTGNRRKVTRPCKPAATVADSADPNDAIFGHGRKFQGDFYDRQAAADTACRAWRAEARPPLHGEQLLDYRRRLLRPLMKFSTQFKDVDLDELREPLLTPIEKLVFADAIRASTDGSTLPEDTPREVVTVDRTGRHISSFYGQPKAWMKTFSGQRRRLIGIKTHFDH